MVTNSCCRARHSNSGRRAFELFRILVPRLVGVTRHHSWHTMIFEWPNGSFAMGVPQMDGSKVENLEKSMDDLGVPLFQETSKSASLLTFGSLGTIFVHPAEKV